MEKAHAATGARRKPSEAGLANSGPTQGAEKKTDPTTVWESRPRLAALLRAGIALGPLVLSTGFSWYFGRILLAAASGVERVAWLVVLTVASTGVIVFSRKLLRMFLPLVALMKLTLVFPDQAPSRMKSALRASSGRNMLKDVDSSEGANLGEMLAELLARVNEHDRLTRGHSERVRAYTEIIGTEMGLPDDEMNRLRWGALLHDVGKVTVPSEILNKNGKPTDEEWQILKGHPAEGGTILEPLRDFLGPWVHAADQHHMRWDGNGYPESLAGLEISLPGRMVAVADAYDVMTSARSYKKPLPHAVARQELTDNSGSQFDPAIVRAFLNAGLDKVRPSVGPFAWIINAVSSGQGPVSVVTTAASTASTIGTAVAAVGVSLFTVTPTDLGAIEVATAPTVVTQAVDLIGDEDAVIRVRLEAEGGNRAGSISVGSADHGSVVLSDGTTSGVATAVALNGPWGVDVRYAPNGEFHGDDTFEYTACGQDDNCSTAKVNVTVRPVNDAPNARDDGASGSVGSAVVVDVLANDTDVDGDALRAEITGRAGHGQARMENNTLIYTPNDGFVGRDTVSYSATDPEGLNAVASVSIEVVAPEEPLPEVPRELPFQTVPVDLPAPAPIAAPIVPPVARPANQAPVANPDFGIGFTTAEDSTFTTADVTANDTDPEKGIDRSSVTLVTGARHGLLASNFDGTFTYTPDRDFVGSDTFTYTVKDDAGLVSEAAQVGITVTAGNDAPVARNDGGVGFTTNEDVVFTTANLTANDTDVDNMVIPASVTLVTGVSDGLLSNNGNGTFSYLPDANFNGTDAFTYRIVDSGLLSSNVATVTITVNPVNDAPIAVDDGGVGFATNEDTAFITATVTANDSDPDEAVDPVSVTIVDQPSHGAVAHNGNGSFTFTPEADYSGSDTFTYRIFDGDLLLSNTATVTVVMNAVNDAPVPVDDLLTVARGGSATTADLRANDVDVDGDALTIVSARNGTNGDTTVNLDGTVTYVHDGTATASDSFDYTVRDAFGAESDATVAVTITTAGEDFDAVPAGSDNCPAVFNIDQRDTDGDGTGDACDASPTAVSTATYSQFGSDYASADSFDVALGDIDGDGDLDAVYANDGANAVWVNNGLGDFVDSGQNLGGSQSEAVALGDLDGDGDLDVVIANSPGANKVFLNDGNGTFIEGETVSSDLSKDVALGDVDGDGDLDIAFVSIFASNKIWLNDGDGSFANSGQTLGLSTATGVTFGDVDGDLDLDMFVANDGFSDRLLINDGSGTFTDSGQNLGIGRSHGGAFGDVDKDGDNDLIIAGDNEGDTVWLNDGSGALSVTAQVIGVGHSRSVGVGDLNGDGDLEIMYGDHSNENTVWLSAGAGLFSDHGQRIGDEETLGIALGDLNGDGDLDAAFANGGDSNQFWSNG